MDPFTEKLLERTRARRENLQKKIAERPAGANRQMAKRPREPLAEANSLIREPLSENALPATKPSPYKRRCSDENSLVEQEVTQPKAALATDSLTDKKPPVAPAAVRHTLDTSVEKAATPTMVSPHPVEAVNVTRELLNNTSDVDMKPSAGPLERAREDLVHGSAAAASGMKSRLQRLADQRLHWDAAAGTGDVVPDIEPIKTQEVVPDPVLVSSGTPVGRKGRLANLAATIGSWEDDLSHPSVLRDNAQGQPGTACAPAVSRTATTQSKPSLAGGRQPPLSQSKLAIGNRQAPVHSPVKSSRVVLPSPRETEVPEPRPAPQETRLIKKPSPPKSSAAPTCIQSPPKAKVLSRDRDLGTNNPVLKPSLPCKPLSTAAQSKERFNQDATPSQAKGSAGTPGVKSFLERFGERCQERSSNNTPLGVSPVATPSGTPKSRLVHERLMTIQTTTATADLTQKQRQERELELAQVRNRHQKGNMWKNRDRRAGNRELNSTDDAESIGSSVDESTVPSMESFSTLSETKATEPFSMELSSTSASSPLKKVEFSSVLSEDIKEDKEGEEVREKEVNVDGSINSEVINDLFDGVLEESSELSAEEDEEDALNISSMSLLTPLAETVASVVKSPERIAVTSTPASSFCEKSANPEGVSKPSRFQRARMLRSGSSDNLDSADDGRNLLYSIDAYRSTRVKETERPHVKQVIVRKEDALQRMEEPRGSGHLTTKQKLKVLANELNLQQTVIHQASQALNCCTDEEHGKGSQVEAEAERLLLIATEKRAALKVELDRLKVDGPGAQRKAPTDSKQQADSSASKGSISLHELRLPLKADFVCSTANKPDSGSHFFFVMIRAGAENMVATPLASARSGLSGDALTFSTKFTLPDVSSDFEIDVEVFYLAQKRELCPDKRKKPNKSKAITPKRFLAITKSNLQTPVMASPGGPNAVRTSNFVLVGSHRLTLASIGKNKFPLEKVPFLCPLEGHIYLKMQCEVGSRVEEKGFLTMFEDVSGFGAWHRRWCVLSGYCIAYWTYPDDERRKNPVGRISLANCTSRKVEPANREFCARPNTFELITVRPQRDDDKETLVSQCRDTLCVTTNWLSADTKEERNLWMQKLNQILVDLRMWQPDSCYRPL
ncbi:anillin isoform X2 [Denticeps clupeoides]|uniref:anillin isoform X2 n=1 Tax=Denticeps clupeoides TaxID=299321 RepID=UPI0010A34C33|nr:anillin isoform X2 [Denticeps clupeoides]